MEFFASPIDTPGLQQKLAEYDTQNPFCSPAYFEAMRKFPVEPWIAGLSQGGKLVSAAGLFIIKGRLNNIIEIPSLPTAADDDTYWKGLRRFSKEHGVTQIEANSFASPPFVLPPTINENERRERQEYVLDIRGISLHTLMSSNHRRNIRKAEAAGLVIVRNRDQDACREHVRLMNLSHDRRRERGENITDGEIIDECLSFLSSGCGELFQAMLGTKVLSSLLVLRAVNGAYYHSAGSTPDGMAVGASHFLISGTAIKLGEEDMRVLNLGSAPAGSSLARFKSGFGAIPVPLIAVSSYVGPLWRRKLTSFARLAQRNPKELRTALMGDLLVMKVYAAETSAITAPPAAEGMEFRALTEKDLRSLFVSDPAFQQRQLDRLGLFGRSYAYGVFSQGRLAHVSWLLPPGAVRMETPHILHLRENDAEITACETLPEFRGKGMYAFAIQQLFQIAHAQGIQRIYMKTAADNKPSQKGILKAGLKQLGSALLIVPPLLPGRTYVLRLFK